MGIRIISAGAGSGKTYRITQELKAKIEQGVDPSSVIATTFTKKAARELQERLRTFLLEGGKTQEAEQISNALIGTVHALSTKLIQRFSFELGLSPKVTALADEDKQTLFNLSLTKLLVPQRVEQIENLSRRLDQGDARNSIDWRYDLLNICELGRTNAFNSDQLEASGKFSFESLQIHLGEQKEITHQELQEELKHQIQNVLSGFEDLGDETKTTAAFVRGLRQLLGRIEKEEILQWREWASLEKLKVAKKSIDHFQDLKSFASTHLKSAAFQNDLKAYIKAIFSLAIDALEEFSQYKNDRGLIDYVDMEVLINKALDLPEVRSVLQEEISLLIVDEFQDTSPIQLQIFLKLSELAGEAIWVGDPKQSIYGFRGADPALMKGIIQEIGVKPEDILKNSWRSRPDIVNACNDVFTRAFSDLPEEQVALLPVIESGLGHHHGSAKEADAQMNKALNFWEFKDSDPKQRITNAWFQTRIAEKVQDLIQNIKPIVYSKSEDLSRPLQPSDIAIICSSNQTCMDMAEKLNQLGIKASVSSSGLVDTQELNLVMACLHFLENHLDDVAIAEILIFLGEKTIDEIVSEKALFLASDKESKKWYDLSHPWIKSLKELSKKVKDLSLTETISILMDRLPIREKVGALGKPRQRWANLEAFYLLAGQFENSCKRFGKTARVDHFSAWLKELNFKKKDMQASFDSEDAVKIVTYHKSKGLEYPIAILMNLDKKPRVSSWGTQVVRPNTQEINFQDVLGGAFLQFWPNPYGKQDQKTTLVDRIKSSETYKEKEKRAFEESARVLYVGMTRARDYLVLPKHQKMETHWINSVFSGSAEDYAQILQEGLESPFSWKNKIIPLESSLTEVTSSELESFQTEQEEEYYKSVQKSSELSINYLPYARDLSSDPIVNPEILESIKEQPLHSFTFESKDQKKKLLPLLSKLSKSFFLVKEPYRSLFWDNTFESISSSLSKEDQSTIRNLVIQTHEVITQNEKRETWILNYPLEVEWEGRQILTHFDLAKIDTEKILLCSFLQPYKGEKERTKQLDTLKNSTYLLKNMYFSNKKSRHLIVDYQKETLSELLIKSLFEHQNVDFL